MLIQGRDPQPILEYDGDSVEEIPSRVVPSKKLMYIFHCLFCHLKIFSPKNNVRIGRCNCGHTMRKLRIVQAEPVPIEEFPEVEP